MNLFSKTHFIMLAGALLLIACSDSSIPKEGKQYIALPTQLAEQSLAPVSEVFSLTCGHCRKMENFLPQISQLSGTEIGKLHITFNQAADNAAQLYYAAEMQLGGVPDHAFMEELFAIIQDKQDSGSAQQQAIAQAFSARNLTSPLLFSAQQNEQLAAKVEQIRRLSQQSAINAVPTFIVNGRYQVLVSGHDSGKEIAATISYLREK